MFMSGLHQVYTLFTTLRQDRIAAMFDFKDVYLEVRQQNIAKEFSRLQDVCYLDHTGSTLYADSQLRECMDDLGRNVYGNPHSLSTTSHYTTDVIDQVRYQVLRHFNTDTNDYSVIFTSGATASLKIIAESFDWSGKRSSVGEETTENDTNYNGALGSFTYIQDNHTSVLGMRELAAEKGASIRCLSFDESFKIFAEDETQERDSCDYSGNSLFAYPAQCNFSGLKYPLSWIRKVNDGILNSRHRQSKWYCVLDAASFVSTNVLDLSLVKPDFVCLSFYKMFGYPTGLGALLVKNTSADVLKKVYFGGGTVSISLSSERFHIPRPILHEHFEDGTLSFLSIISVRHGLSCLTSLSGGMALVAQHTFNLARYLHHRLVALHHANHAPAVKIYADNNYEDIETQGGIVNLNVLRASGEHVGYMEVLNMANLHGIQLRTGCFCNPGACQRHLQLSTQQLRTHFQAGHVCGDDKDLIDGVPTGSIRVSFGYMSTQRDADRFYNLIRDCFVEGEPIEKMPASLNKTYLFQDRSFQGTEGSLTDARHNHLTSGENVTKNIGRDVRSQMFNSVKPTVTSYESDGMYVANIFVYPVKSCAALSVSHWPIGPRGLKFDREWMIVTAAGVSLTQKQDTKMCLIRPSIDLDEECLVLEFEDLPSISLPLYSSSVSVTVDICQSKVCGDRVQGWDCGDAVAAWLSAALRRDGLRMIRQQDCAEGRSSKQRRVEPGVAKPALSLSNQAQYLLLTMASIDWLRERISEDSDCDRDDLLQRFRSNLVVRGGEPFAEYRWSSLTIGDHRFQFEGLCTRCQMVCIDQSTGEKTREPLKTLAEKFHGKMKFGAYFSHVSLECETSIACGDRVIPIVEETNT